MSKQSPLVGKYKRVTDKKTIEELDKLPLYIPDHESVETFDTDAMNRNAHKVSSEFVGELRPIEVAVWFDDPEVNVPNSHSRVHLRIINGRHRYLQKLTWRREYYDLSGFKTIDGEVDPVIGYFEARHHFDLQKKSNPKERSVLVEEMAEYLNKKGLDAPECCKKIVELLVHQGVAHETTIINACPSRYKDIRQSQIKLGKTFESKGKETAEMTKAKKITKVEEKESKIRSLEMENVDLEKKISAQDVELKKQYTIIDDLQSKIRILSQLEDTQEIDGIKIHVSIDGASNKIILKKV